MDGDYSHRISSWHFIFIYFDVKSSLCIWVIQVQTWEIQWIYLRPSFNDDIQKQLGDFCNVLLFYQIWPWIHGIKFSSTLTPIVMGWHRSSTLTITQPRADVERLTCECFCDPFASVHLLVGMHLCNTAATYPREHIPKYCFPWSRLLVCNDDFSRRGSSKGARP